MKSIKLLIFTSFVLGLSFFLYSSKSVSHNVSAQTSSSGWYMAGANPARTTWSSESVTSGSLLWYRPIEAYIDQKAQLIATNGMIYVSTSRGLIALDAANGSLRWRYDTQLPLGNSPTVDTTQNPAVLYVGGTDKKLYALNANTGQQLWTYDGAKAPYNTNPLVVEGKVILGNRDGGLYAVNAVGSTGAGQLAWKFQTDGPINFSAAYKNGTAYIASNDNHAYAVRVSNGTQVWKSAKLPGDGFHSYYPVIYRDKVVYSTTYQTGSHIANEFRMKNSGGVYEPIYPDDPLASGVGGLIGDIEGTTSWSNGFQTLHPWRILEHFEDNPDGDPLFHRPQNRAFLVLNQSNGQEFTFDSDGDGFREFIPFSFWNDDGTQFPIIVDPSDQLAYAGTPIACCSDAKGKLYSWNIDDPSKLGIVGASVNNGQISQTGGWAAMAEPQAFSGGGNAIYRNLCCDRVGDWFRSTSPSGSGQFWSYNIGTQAPNYDPMWEISPVSISRHQGWYKGSYDTTAGIYHNHGDQAPLIPYNGRVYAHRSNAIFAYGSGTAQGQLPLISANEVTSTVALPHVADLISKLESEVQKIVDVNGHLRPGTNEGDLFNYGGNRYEFEDYFSNPGDTLYTLSYAYPHLNSSLKQQVANYLNQELFPYYFDTSTSTNPTMYVHTGFTEGASREWREVSAEYFAQNSPQNKGVNPGGGWSFQYPQHNLYSMFMYAKNIPGANVSRIYTLAKAKLKVPTGLGTGEATIFERDAFQHNAWITGYHGFLKLQELAGMTQTDTTLRTSVTNELNRLVSLRASMFDRESPWVDMDAGTATNAKKPMDVASNFMYLTPETAESFRNNSQLFQKAQDALNMYEDIAPFWFIGKYESQNGEAVLQHLYNQPSLFQAKAWIMRQPREELYKHLDTPMFARGDLFYIQNLVATIEAPTDPNYTPPPTSASTPTPAPVPGDANGDRVVDGLDYLVWLNNYGDSVTGASNGDFNNSGSVDGLDYVIWLNNYGN